MQPNYTNQPAPRQTLEGQVPQEQIEPQLETELSEPLLLDDQPEKTTIQTFPVVYDNNTFIVNLNGLINSSIKFKELIQPYLNDKNQLLTLHLRIADNSFTIRNIKNFLQLCQNLPSDVQDSEMEEICEIAKMFQADQIYNTGITFIHNSIDPNFNVPDNKYNGSDGKTYLFIEGPTNVIHHEDDNVNEPLSDDENEETPDNSNTSPNSANDTMNTQSKPKNDSVVYTIYVEHPLLSLVQYKFRLNGKTFFSAKKQDNNVYIGEGNEIHINTKTDNHIAHIYLDTDKSDIIFLKDQQIHLKLVNSGRPNHLSVEVTFKNRDRMISWMPKPPKYNAIEDKYSLNFHGEYHHAPITSKKNIVLQNKNGHATFIVRKMDIDKFEVECLPLVDPLIAFTIALSDIIGPYNDPCGDIEL